MILLGAFFGHEFNQNGDLGNLDVLRRALSLHGQDVEVRPDVQSNRDLLELDYLVIGDASRAYQRKRMPALLELANLIHERDSLNRQTLIVGSSFELLAGPVFTLNSTARPERVSEYRSVETQSGTVWGYVNSDSELPLYVQKGSTTGTLFFGPLLARNPWIVSGIAKTYNLELDQGYLSRISGLMGQSPNYSEALRNRY